MTIHRLAVVLLAALSVACEARLALGGTCARTSECAVPFACVAGRCREECADHRDCTPGTRCLAGNDGLLVCSFEDERCTADADCAEDLVCRSGACFDACPAGTCPAGGVCADGVCARPDGSDAGLADAGVGFPRRVGCTSDTDCGEGVCTRTLGGAYECRVRCGTAGDCPPAPTTVGCGYFQALAGGLVLGCSLPCDLFGAGASGCTAGTTCDAFEISTDSVNAPVVDCRAVDSGAFGPGGECGRMGVWDPTICAAGLSCDGADPYTCQELCTVTGAFGPACPGGTTCDAFPFPELHYRGARIGSCDPI